MSFKPGDLVRLVSGSFAMTVSNVDDAGIECSWCEGKRLRSKIFKPDVLAAADQAPTINVKFVTAGGDK